MNVNLPPFIPADISKLEDKAVAYDQKSYNLADQDMAARYGGFVRGKRKAAKQIGLEFGKGNTTLGPQIQSELMTAGLTKSLDNVGDSVGTLAPGSAGEAGLAKNLGIGVMDFQRANDAQKWGHLLSFAGLAPEKQFGLTGPDVAQVQLANIAGQNNFNQTEASAEAGGQQADQNAKAQKGQQRTAMIGAGAGILAAGLIVF